MHTGWSLVLAAVFATSGAAAQAPAIKTLRIVVGFSVGGGYDTYARMLSRHLGRHLPGTPVVIVQNMPGAAGLKALQYLDNGAPTDGSVITAFNPGSITEFLINPDTQRFNFLGVAWIGSISRDLRACYAWAATGIKSFDDLKRYKEFNMGAPARGTSSYINSAVLKTVFGVAVHHVVGYTGSAEQRLAIERGELDGDCGARSSLPADWLGAARSMRRSASRPDRSLACRPACRLRATLRRHRRPRTSFWPRPRSSTSRWSIRSRAPMPRRSSRHFMPLRLRWSRVHRRWWRSSKPP
jgi:tripartite-type tricarboxylate transporter receptor subunit TctC